MITLKVKVKIRGLSKKFGDFLVLNNIDLDIYDGEFLMITGPSGCGKSTLLKILCGLEDYDGNITLDGRSVRKPDSSRFLVFQEFDQLLPWKTVYKNIEFGLKLRKMPNREPLIRELIKLVGLTRFEDYYPYELSGGMKQRCAIARALAMNPEVLLMDEPFGSLDAYLRRKLRKEMIRIFQEIRKTVIFVTHSIRESIMLGDRIVVLSKPPSRIKKIFTVNLARTQNREESFPLAFTRLQKQIENEIEA